MCFVICTYDLNVNLYLKNKLLWRYTKNGNVFSSFFKLYCKKFKPINDFLHRNAEIIYVNFIGVASVEMSVEMILYINGMSCKVKIIYIKINTQT